MIADFFQYFSVIDVHDHYRQGSLELLLVALTSVHNYLCDVHCGCLLVFQI